MLSFEVRGMQGYLSAVSMIDDVSDAVLVNADHLVVQTHPPCHLSFIGGLGADCSYTRGRGPNAHLKMARQHLVHNVAARITHRRRCLALTCHNTLKYLSRRMMRLQMA